MAGPGCRSSEIPAAVCLVSQGQSRPGLYQWERNPYYWKVDAQGNQLPYIDTMRFDYVAANENHKVKLAQGEVDILGQHIVTMADYPFYKDNQPRATTWSAITSPAWATA